MAPQTPSPSPLYQLAGREVGGRYQLTRPIAHGGMAAVWEANDLVLGRQVAVKILHEHFVDDPDVVKRFRAEAVAAARLHHPAIVSIYDTIAEPGIEAIVMELVRGPTLRQYLDRNSPLDPERVVDLGAQVADALAVAHEAGIVHRDVKPANILLGDDGQIRVTDFGIAKALDATQHTRQGVLLGTAKYIAPEQVAGEPVDGRADIYSLATVLYEAITGRVPFDEGNAIATANARLDRRPLRPRQVRVAVPKDLDRVIDRALSRDPTDRYGTIRDFRAALRATTDDQTIVEVADPTEVDESPSGSFPESERRWLVPAMIIVLIGGSLTLAALLIGGSDTGRDLIRETGERLGIVETAPGGPAGSNGAPAGDAADTAAAGEPETSPPIGELAASVSLTSFDPFGTGEPGENDALLPLAVDGDAATVWRTEGYANPAFGGLKPGLGVVLALDEPLDVATIELVGPAGGWRADVYTNDVPAADLDGWGPPLASLTVDAATTIPIDASVGAVLVWIVDLGPTNTPSRVEIGEIRILPG